ncbi:sialidase family protein [Allorhodopirellula heiligendammensis]|uniref:BNR/Asp-box repeat protein n=1 Tax=Allorhodopirellula heiligendammensis TaxID=2714739 RepID=A0A5C6BVG4_9BACT|nr:sialidase family protein [Allorhodopirellula heiligendammensis]TWU16270.1 hypothetical protein Poly21_34750 [Allorhodopirellula heiligendammensis]
MTPVNFALVVSYPHGILAKTYLSSLIPVVATWMLLVIPGIVAAETPPGETLAAEAKVEPVPGTVIAHRPASTGVFIGSPSIAILPNGDYVASHDQFGEAAKKQGQFGVVQIYRSSDRGESWTHLSTVTNAHWSNLFVHHGALYLLGTFPGDIVIRRSDDGGVTWTDPVDGKTGRLTDEGVYHTAPTPVVVHQGRLVRAFEKSEERGFSGLKPCLLSVDEDADLLDSGNWFQSEPSIHDRSWLPGNEFRGWLEGNAVVGPQGELVNMLRVHTFLGAERAAILTFADSQSRHPVRDEPEVVFMPGGAKKFSIRYDEETNRYWALVNWVPEADQQPHPARYRNRLALVSSEDLRHWDVIKTIIAAEDANMIGFQYADFVMDGNDIVAVSRTAFPGETGGADNYHNANFMTFHRIENFRGL